MAFVTLAAGLRQTSLGCRAIPWLTCAAVCAREIREVAGSCAHSCGQSPYARPFASAVSMRRW
eukprot:7752967-Heterocapsa_arctica.AAC.1